MESHGIAVIISHIEFGYINIYDHDQFHENACMEL